MIKVSICCPVYGVEKFIERCVISLMEQTYENIEYIFVNDCTIDQSWNILKDVLNQYPHKKQAVKLYSHNSNKGSSETRNTAKELASGDFLVWVDTDDYIEKNMIEEFVKLQNETNADFITCEYWKHNPNGRRIKCGSGMFNNREQVMDYITSAKGHNNIWARFIRTSLYREYNIRFIEGINVGEDLQTLVPIVYHAKRFATLHKPLYHYECTNSTSYTSSFSIEKAKQSIDSVTIAFKSIGNDVKYEKLFIRKKLFVIANQMANICKIGIYKDYFYYLKMELHQIPKKYWKLIGAYSLMFYYPNYFVGKTITKLVYLLRCHK